MRQLTKRQKAVLIQWGRTQTIEYFSDLSWEQIRILERINNTEILGQEVNRFLEKDRKINYKIS